MRRGDNRLDFRSLQVTAPLGPGQGVATIARRLARVAGFYACAAVFGAAVVLLVALLAWASDYLPALEGTTLLSVLAAVWGILLLGLIILLIYRSTLTLREDDQLFLDETESHLQDEQSEILSRVNRVTIFVRYVGVASGTLTLMLALFYVFAHYSNTN